MKLFTTLAELTAIVSGRSLRSNLFLVHSMLKDVRHVTIYPNLSNVNSDNV
jgi:hypothetical protein